MKVRPKVVLRDALIYAGQLKIFKPGGGFSLDSRLADKEPKNLKWLF